MPALQLTDSSAYVQKLRERGGDKELRAFLAEHPEIRLAGPTWRWLEAAYRSMAQMEQPGFAEAIVTPCLIFGAGRDRSGLFRS